MRAQCYAGDACETSATRIFIHPTKEPFLACETHLPEGVEWRPLEPGAHIVLDMEGAGAFWHGRAGQVKRVKVLAGMPDPDRAHAVIAFPNRKRGITFDARDLRPKEGA